MSGRERLKMICPVSFACFGVTFAHAQTLTHTNSIAYLLCTFLFQFVNRCDVKFLPIYVPSAEEQQDPTLFADNCQVI